ncbi:hypothetical protein ABZX51_001642 [Aspergillus tubingensis]
MATTAPKSHSRTVVEEEIFRRLQLTTTRIQEPKPIQCAAPHAAAVSEFTRADRILGQAPHTGDRRLKRSQAHTDRASARRRQRNNGCAGE